MTAAFALHPSSSSPDHHHKDRRKIALGYGREISASKMKFSVATIAEQHRLVGRLGLKVTGTLATAAHLLVVVAVVVPVLFIGGRRGGSHFRWAETNAEGIPTRGICRFARLSALVDVATVPLETSLLQHLNSLHGERTRRLTAQVLFVVTTHLIDPPAEALVWTIWILGPGDVAVAVLRLELEEVREAFLPRLRIGSRGHDFTRTLRWLNWLN